MKKILIVAIFPLLLFLFSSCTMDVDFEIPNSASPKFLANIMSKNFEMVSSDEVDEFMGREVDGVAAVYKSNGMVCIAQFLLFKRESTARFLFEEQLLKNLIHVKKFSETFKKGYLEIRKSEMGFIIILSDKWIVYIEGKYEFVKDFAEVFIMELNKMVSL